MTINVVRVSHFSPDLRVQVCCRLFARRFDSRKALDFARWMHVSLSVVYAKKSRTWSIVVKLLYEVRSYFSSWKSNLMQLYYSEVIHMDCEQEHEAPETRFLLVRTRVCKTMFSSRWVRKEKAAELGRLEFMFFGISSGVKKIQSVLGLEFEATDLELERHRHDE